MNYPGLNSYVRNVAVLLVAGTVGASAQQKPAVDTAKIDAAIAAAFPTAPADWKARFEQDETTKACSLHENSPPKPSAVTPAPTSPSTMIYHCIRYTIDPQKLDDFETYARRWMEGGIIKRCGGQPLGYFLPKKGYGGPDNIAMTLIGFKSLAAYEEYRAKLIADPEAKENLEFAKRSGCILTEDRSYFYRVGNEH